MDANELSVLLEDVREYMTYVGTGARAYIQQVTDVARENTPAHSAIGHVIEQYLLKADPAHKIGALYCIDSISQNIGEPYVSYFSNSIGKMFSETWKHSSTSTRDRMKRWLQHYTDKGVFPPHILSQIRQAIDPDGAQKVTQRADPRQRRPVVTPTNNRINQLPNENAMRPLPMPRQQNAAIMPTHGMPGYPQAPYMTAMVQPTLGERFAGIKQLQIPRFESQKFLAECTRKIHVHLNDKRIARERAKREGRAAKSRQWFPTADMWLKGTAAVESSAPVQEVAKKEVVEETRMFVIKDEKQPTCAISGEPFNEEWDEELQEWIYTNALKIPELPQAVGLQKGAIVKVAVLHPRTVEQIKQLTAAEKKRKGVADSGSNKRARSLANEVHSDDDDDGW